MKMTDGNIYSKWDKNKTETSILLFEIFSYFENENDKEYLEYLFHMPAKTNTALNNDTLTAQTHIHLYESNVA